MEFGRHSSVHNTSLSSFHICRPVLFISLPEPHQNVHSGGCVAGIATCGGMGVLDAGKTLLGSPEDTCTHFVIPIHSPT